jgi:hypothetical protein
VIEAFRERYKLKTCTLKEIDRYLFVLGKEKFSNVKKKKTWKKPHDIEELKQKHISKLLEWFDSDKTFYTGKEKQPVDLALKPLFFYNGDIYYSTDKRLATFPKRVVGEETNKKDIQRLKKEIKGSVIYNVDEYGHEE